MCSNDEIIENCDFSTPNRCARIIDSSYDSETCNGSIFYKYCWLWFIELSCAVSAIPTGLKCETRNSHSNFNY